MYPLQCHAGFPMPLKAGKMEIVGYFVAPEVVGTAMEIMLVDDRTISQSDNFGKLLSSTDPTANNTKTVISWERILAGYNGVQGFGEPIKTRHGISVYCSNVKAGSFCVYVK